MDNTNDIPAWWGAILSSILALVEGVRYLTARPKLRASVTLVKSEDYKYPSKIVRVNMSIVSTHETTLTHVNVRIYPDFSLKHRFRGMVIISAALLGSGPLPRRIQAADILNDWLDADFLYDSFSNAKGLFVFEIYDTLHHKPKTIKCLLIHRLSR